MLDEMAMTINNKPISTKYFKSTSSVIQNDRLGTHEQKVGVNRDGEEVIVTDTYPIGHFVTDGYYGEFDGKEVLMADAVGYVEHFPDVFALLQEWVDNGIQVNTSCEYYYRNFEMIDGVEHIKSPIVFSRHVVLNSERRGGIGIVDGAYSDSQLLSINMQKSWNEVLQKDVELLQAKNSKEEEGERMTDMFKKVCELSHDNIRSKIYEELRKVQPTEEYNDSWINEVYDTRFILYFYQDDKYVEVPYTKTENDVEINYEAKVEVQRDWVAVSNQLEEMTQSVNSLTEELESVKAEKVELEVSVNEASEKLISLNARVEELSEIEKAVNEEKLEKAINEVKEKFEIKFKALNALEKFESEEVQALIEKSVSDESAIVSINSMLIDLIELKEEVVETVEVEDLQSNGVKVLNNKHIGDLIPKSKQTIEDKYFNY